MKHFVEYNFWTGLSIGTANGNEISQATESRMLFALLKRLMVLKETCVKFVVMHLVIRRGIQFQMLLKLCSAL